MTQSIVIFSFMLISKRLLITFWVFPFIHFSYCSRLSILTIISKAWVFPISSKVLMLFSWPFISFSRFWDEFLCQLWQTVTISLYSSCVSWLWVFFICRFWLQCRRWSFRGFCGSFWETRWLSVRNRVGRISLSLCKWSRCGWFWWSSMSLPTTLSLV